MRALAEWTRTSRASAAEQLVKNNPVHPLSERVRAPWLVQLLSLRGLMSEANQREIDGIEKDWNALQHALSKGALSAPESFARHTQLLDRQLALQSSLRSAGL